MRSIIITLILLSLGLATSGCNTMQGMGKDIKGGGEKLEDSAEKHKSY